MHECCDSSASDYFMLCAARDGPTLVWYHLWVTHVFCNQQLSGHAALLRVHVVLFNHKVTPESGEGDS